MNPITIHKKNNSIYYLEQIEYEYRFVSIMLQNIENKYNKNISVSLSLYNKSCSVESNARCDANYLQI